MADQVRQIKNKKWLDTAEQEEIAIRVRHEHQEIETTELHATDTKTMNIRRLKLRSFLPQIHQTMQQHLIPKIQHLIHQREEEPRVFAAEELQEEISPELETLCDRMLDVTQLEQRIRLPSLKERTKLKAEVEKINEAVKRIQTHNITEVNSLMYAAAYITTEIMGMLKGRKGRRNEEPFWERTIKGNIKTWRKDLSKIEEVRRGNMRLKQRERERLNRKYHLEYGGTLYVSGMLKQKIKAGGVKIKRYDERCQQRCKKISASLWRILEME